MLQVRTRTRRAWRALGWWCDDLCLSDPARIALGIVLTALSLPAVILVAARLGGGL